ncbi:MAG: ATP-binding protein [Myxococcales bacterium]|nr:ATP-binding protein [Myxococcales bacterium]
MISPLAVVLFCISALGVTLGLGAQMIVRDGTHSPYRFFSVFMYALALNAFGAAVLTDAPNLEAGYWAQRLQQVGQATALLCCIDFELRATGSGTPLLARLLRGTCWVLLALAASGLMLAPGRLPPTPLVTLPFAHHYHEAPPSVLGYLAYCVAGLLVARCALLLFKHAPEEVQAPVLYSMPLVTLSIAHDLMMRFGVLESVYLMEFMSAFHMLVMSTSRAQLYVRNSAALRQRSADLESNYHKLALAQDALVQRRRLSAIGELSAVLAHEVRNPLAVIKNAAASLRRHETLGEETKKRLLAISEEELSRLARLIDDMLIYAKPLKPSISPHSPATLIDAAVGLATSEPGIPTDIAIDKVGCDADDHVLRADGRLVSLALANLLSNALKATVDGGRVTIGVSELASTRELGPALRFQVRDDGEGMDTSTRKKATEPFFTTRPKGMGLGLAIADQVARAHHGRLELHSEAGRGATVDFILPVC